MPLAQCQAIREIKKLILSGELDRKTQEIFLDYLTGCLSSNNKEMVIIEASKALTELSSIGIDYSTNIFGSLQNLLGKSKFIMKYAALKMINKIAYFKPDLVSNCKTDLETLVTHINKSVASMAISILLKICKEIEIEPLLARICTYLPDIGDEFRVDAIRSVKLLAKRCPNSCKYLVTFLKKCLRMYSNADFKREIIE